MATTFELSPTPYFEKKYVRLIKKNKQIKEKFIGTLDTLQINPFDSSLKTHKVNAKIKPGVFSSRVTGDLRIIWEFSDTEISVIDLLDLGGHSGSGSVY
jgi:mRNA interferase YafQ